MPKPAIDETDINVLLEEKQEDYRLKILHDSKEVASKNISENEITEYYELIENIFSKEPNDLDFLRLEDHEYGKKVRELGEPEAYCVFREDEFIDPKDYL
jgi:hypothetical protein